MQNTNPSDALNAKFKSDTLIDRNKIITFWKTSYGVTFYDYHDETDDGVPIYGYEYDDGIIGVTNEYKKGSISGNNIIKALEIFEINPNKLREKSDSITKLEQITRKDAVRHYSGFGKWHIYVSNQCSLFNDPFSDKDEFEIYFTNSLLEGVSIDEVIRILQTKKLI